MVQIDSGAVWLLDDTSDGIIATIDLPITANNPCDLDFLHGHSFMYKGETFRITGTDLDDEGKIYVKGSRTPRSAAERLLKKNLEAMTSSVPKDTKELIIQSCVATLSVFFDILGDVLGRNESKVMYDVGRDKRERLVPKKDR